MVYAGTRRWRWRTHPQFHAGRALREVAAEVDGRTVMVEKEEREREEEDSI